MDIPFENISPSMVYESIYNKIVVIKLAIQALPESDETGALAGLCTDIINCLQWAHAAEVQRAPASQPETKTVN